MHSKLVDLLHLSHVVRIGLRSHGALFLISLTIAGSFASVASAEKGIVAPIVGLQGQSFHLAQSCGAAEIETHEYTLEGESLKDWSQLVTVQRLNCRQQTLPKDFITYSKERLARDPSQAAFLTQPAGKRSGLFTVHFRKTEEQEEQIVVCLVLQAPSDPQRLQILQYAAKPGRLSPPLLEAQLRAWKERFQAQASQLESGSSEQMR